MHEFPSAYVVITQEVNDLMWAIAVRFVDIVRMVDHGVIFVY